MREFPATFSAWLMATRHELAEEQGRAKVTTSRPTCPVCGTLLEIFWGRNSRAYLVIHSVRDCERRFDRFGTGETEEKAWEEVKRGLTAQT